MNKAIEELSELELNQAIATEIFGLTLHKDEEECFSTTPGAKWVHGGEYYEVDVWYAYPPEQAGTWEVFGDAYYLQDYSSSIAAAWLVVEKMREAGWTLSIYAQDSSQKQPYGVEMWQWGNDSDHDAMMAHYHRTGQETIYADTAARAICVAALRAMRSGKQDG